MKKKKNEDPLPKLLNSPADGTNVSLPCLQLGCKSLVRPLVEDLFTNHANGPGRPPALVPSVGLFNIFEVGPHSLKYFSSYQFKEP